MNDKEIACFKKRWDWTHEKLMQAIDETTCPYCGAVYGEPCRTVKGRAPGTAYPGLLHAGRLHGGHCLLVEIGDPIIPYPRGGCGDKTEE